MKMRLLGMGLAMVGGAAWGDVIISEVMYHPPSELIAEEFVELHNTGPSAVDVSGWAFTSGVSFTLPPATAIPADGRLVVAADAAAFAAKYPTVSPVVAGWVGRLSNSSNKITLVDALGTKVDEVNYADDGDWAVRRKDWWSNFGHKGVSWDSGADGKNDIPPYSNAPADVLAKDRSLELVNAAFDNSPGQNWLASLVPGGTPGAPNSVAATNIAPVIRDVGHFPAVPKSTDPVYVTARVTDDLGAVVTAKTHWRVDGAASFTEVAMADDGLHGDTLAGDGIFGATIPGGQGNGTIVEFYVSASDGTHSRTWPAPVLGDDAALTPQQTANCLYQVDDTAYAGAMPIYRLVMKAADKTELAGVNSGGSHPYPYYTDEENDQTKSHARFNASFVSADGSGGAVRYRVGVRNRGNGSRTRQPQGLNLMFPNDDPWQGVTQVNLNSQYTPYQLFGAVLFAQAGVPAPQSRAVQVRWNAANPAAAGGSPSYGFYACNEAWNSDLTDHRFPNDSSGNLYRAVRLFQDTTPGGTSIPNGADLSKIVPGGSETLSLVELYKLNYKKQTNTAEDSWTDLIGLTTALAKGHSGALYTDAVTWDADYVSAVRAVADVEEWMRWFAVNTIIDNNETNLSNGDGDDFNFYFGVTDPKCKLMPYDLDTILGGGDSAGSPTASLFRMIKHSTTSTSPTPANAFMKHPEFAPVYYAALKSMIDGPFKPANFDPLAQQTLGGVVSQSVIDAMKSFNAARTTHVASQIPLAISVTTAPTVTSGYPRSTTVTTDLGGKANAITTRAVKVNGVAATWTAWNTTWSASSVALKPGINRVLIQSFDGSGIETERLFFDVWYDDSTVATASGTLASDTTWTSAGGPYSVTASLIVPAGVTLTIEPGTTVYLAAGVGLTVNDGGRILANGTEIEPIRFSRTPGATTSWSGITISGSTTGASPLTEIRNAHFEFNGSTAIHTRSGAEVELEALTFGNTAVPYLSLDSSSFLVFDCVFPTTTASFEGLHGSGGIKTGGHGIVRHCFFGATNGYNDVFDFTGGQRPAPVLQMIDNVFTGSGDDILDLDGTDAWIEGNIFLHCHKNGSPDSASAVSGGSNGAETSEITIIGNLFYDVDHATTAKQGNYYNFSNNTVVRQTKSGGTDTGVGVFNLADDGTTSGAGFLIEANILSDCELLVQNYDSGLSVVTMNNNLMNFTWGGPGAGNVGGDPLFQHVPTMAETTFASWSAAQVMRQWFALKPGSPAIGSGPNGRDKGGVFPRGVCLSPDVPAITNLTAASVAVGPQPSTVPPWTSGYTHYRWRLDGGVWSGETAVSTPVSLTDLTDGAHVVQVAGKNDAGYWQDDAAFGAAATVAEVSWTVDSGYVPPSAAPLVRINEVLAKNGETLGVGGTFPDVIELHNAGNAQADLSGWGLSDTSALPYRYVFPPGTILAPGAYLLVYASSAVAVPEPKTGFGLDEEGETIVLTRSAGEGGGVADSVAFGHQLSDFTIGRRFTDGGWDLCFPTLGTANVVAAQGDPQSLLINEWLASDGALSATDFIELFNPGALPVNIGGGYLTDNPVGWPDRHWIRPLTFVGASGYTQFKADGDPEQGADHLSFRLDATQGEIGLATSDGSWIDMIAYGPQSTDVSQGRSPNGSSVIVLFTQPTPGGPNPGSTAASGTTTVNLLPVDATWKYKSGATSYHGVYEAPGYDDSTWASGPQLLHIESGTLTSASGFVKRTGVPADATNSNRPFKTTYFRTHFNWSGPATGVVLRATTMIDDAAVIYLNGQEVARPRMPSGTISYDTVASAIAINSSEAGEEFIDLPANLLVQGDNVIAAEVHQYYTGTTQSSSDVVWGMKLDADVTSSVPAAQVVINEVLVCNEGLPNPDTSLAGWVEIYNPADSEVNISDMSLTTSVGTPRAWVVPGSTLIPAGGFLVIQCDPSQPVSATNAGLALGASGGGVYLFHTTALGGGLRDSVTWGNQLADLSIGRMPNGTGAFVLNVPTRGALNIAAATGPLTSVRINEWLANPAAGSDFFELFNTGSTPVLLGGNYLTDTFSNKTKNLIAPLTFIGGSGPSRWLQYVADSNASVPGHVNFGLSASGEELGLYTAAGGQLDAVAFGPQSFGISEGSYLDGGDTILALVPTPGAANVALDGDADGMPDAWETANGLLPGDSSDAALDADGDGMSNLAEYLAGTDPHDGGSRLTGAVSGAGGTLLVEFIAQAGKSYTVQVSETMLAGGWQRLADVAPQPLTGAVSVADPAASGRPARFYRILTPAQP